jgi:hypothetical protein
MRWKLAMAAIGRGIDWQNQVDSGDLAYLSIEARKY